MYIDCRQYPSETRCSVSIAADGHKDSPDLPNRQNDESANVILSSALKSVMENGVATRRHPEVRFGVSGGHIARHSLCPLWQSPRCFQLFLPQPQFLRSSDRDACANAAPEPSWKWQSDFAVVSVGTE